VSYQFGEGGEAASRDGVPAHRFWRSPFVRPAWPSSEALALESYVAPSLQLVIA
jgi:hypothetical protein